jgi:hypothetical protein
MGCTNCLQLSIPSVGLLMVWILGALGLDNIQSMVNGQFASPLPYFFGMEYRGIANVIGEPLIVTNCDKWLMVDWENGTIKETKEYFGKNSGVRGEDTSGIINGKKNVLMSHCNQIDRMVPYFKDWPDTNS